MAANEAQLRVSVPVALRDAVAEVAENNGVSQSVVVRSALQKMFGMPGPRLVVPPGPGVPIGPQSSG